MVSNIQISYNRHYVKWGVGSDLVEYSLIFYMKEDTLNRVKRSIDFLSIPLVFILYSKILIVKPTKAEPMMTLSTL